MIPEELERARRWGAASGMGIALRAGARRARKSSVDRLAEAVEALKGPLPL